MWEHLRFQGPPLPRPWSWFRQGWGWGWAFSAVGTFGSCIQLVLIPCALEGPGGPGSSWGPTCFSICLEEHARWEEAGSGGVLGRNGGQIPSP